MTRDSNRWKRIFPVDDVLILNWSVPFSDLIFNPFSPVVGIQRSELDIRVRSLSLLLNRTEYEVARANISKFDAHIIRDTNSEIIGDVTTMNGHLGSMSLFDMTPTHGDLYNERFITSGLDFYIKRFVFQFKYFIFNCLIWMSQNFLSWIGIVNQTDCSRVNMILTWNWICHLWRTFIRRDLLLICNCIINILLSCKKYSTTFVLHRR